MPYTSEQKKSKPRVNRFGDTDLEGIILDPPPKKIISQGKWMRDRGKSPREEDEGEGLTYRRFSL
jgi:hypothetical protein